jgi:hypothetical protein
MGWTHKTRIQKENVSIMDSKQAEPEQVKLNDIRERIDLDFQGIFTSWGSPSLESSDFLSECLH